MTKTAQLDHDPNHNHLADPNDTARYTFTATNTGTTTINNLSINDPMLQGAKTAVTCAETALPPAEATTCTTDTPMTINPENITPFITPGNHTLPNTAAAHGTTPPEPTTGKPAIDVFSPSARATIPLVDALIATPAPPTDPGAPIPTPTDPPAPTPAPNQPTPTPLTHTTLARRRPHKPTKQPRTPIPPKPPHQ
ncbi:DUF7507 domain-containing protein [Dermatophilus congolensis]|uniref:DUF7507 domain-containing protein n=1 Tax=Dermatophilus congolensis TaxID=1863 RepID=UPI0039862128